jgi:Asp-tRNA(Asn)/Glu-tRNA(Gln) amidotransferase A subunit family amidase
VLTLAAPGEAPGRETTGDPIMNIAWTALGLPCLTLPLLKGPGGRSIGLQIVEKMFDDERVLAIGATLEE